MSFGEDGAGPPDPFVLPVAARVWPAEFTVRVAFLLLCWPAAVPLMFTLHVRAELRATAQLIAVTASGVTPSVPAVAPVRPSLAVLVHVTLTPSPGSDRAGRGNLRSTSADRANGSVTPVNVPAAYVAA